MGFPQQVKEEVMILCARHCCLCENPKGLKMEVHHIVHRSEGGDDTLANAIPLCFDCHADMRSYDSKHPKGLKYSRNELIRRRDDWYAKVKSNGIRPASPGNSAETDQKVLEHLVKVLPWNGSISFIKQNNFAGFSFDCDRLLDFGYFRDACENPFFRFTDQELESLRSQLVAHLHAFERAIGQHTFRVGVGSRNTVLPDWEFEQPERFDLAVNEIHGAASLAVQSYETLIAKGREKLGIVLLA